MRRSAAACGCVRRSPAHYCSLRLSCSELEPAAEARNHYHDFEVGIWGLPPRRFLVTLRTLRPLLALQRRLPASAIHCPNQPLMVALPLNQHDRVPPSSPVWHRLLAAAAQIADVWPRYH